MATSGSCPFLNTTILLLQPASGQWGVGLIVFLQFGFVCVLSVRQTNTVLTQSPEANKTWLGDGDFQSSFQ